MTLFLRQMILFAPADEPAGGGEQETGATSTPAPGASPEGQVDPDEGLSEGAVDLTAEDLEKAGLTPAAEGEGEGEGEGDDVADDQTGTQTRPQTRTRNRAGGQPASSRIRQLTAEKRAEANRARELEEQLAASERSRKELEQKHSKTEAATFGYYKEATKGKLEKAKKDLLDAKTAGDAEAEVNAQADLAKYSADWREIENWESANPPAKPGTERQETQRQTTEQRPQQRQTRQTTSEHPDTADWIESNPWFQIDNKRAFDREMHEEAALLGAQLERRYTRAGKPEMVGSREYFAEIDKHMRAEFPDYEWPEPEPQRGARTRQVPRMQGRDTVSQATRQAPQTQNNGNNLGTSNTRITLTVEERGMARRMGLKHPNGKPLTDAEHEKVFALNKLRLQRDDEAAGKADQRRQP